MIQTGDVKLKILFAAVLYLTLASGAFAQKQADESWRLQTPDNCEGNSRRLDSIRNKAQAGGERQVIIAIARLGKGERTPELNRRRLHTVRSYLTAMRLPTQKLVTAEGERVSGYGRVEIYVGGELADVLAAAPCEDLLVGMCENDMEDRQRYQLPRKGKSGRCR